MIAGLAAAGRARREQVRLASAELRGLEALLGVGPAASGYADQCRPLAWIADQVWQRFGAERALAAMDALLHRIGWSCRSRPAGRDEAAIAA